MTFDPELEPDLRRHRQRLALGAQQAQPGRRRQPLPRLDRRAQSRHRQVRLALPGDTRRQLGLHLDAADDPGRPHDRRRAAQGDPARAEERLLLRHRPHQRQVHLGEELRRRELGHRLRRQRPADRGRPRRARRTSRTTSIPGPFGAHNWHPMSFNPQTGLVYLPAQNIPVNLMDDKNWTYNGNQPGEPHGGLGWNIGHVRQRRAAEEQAVRPADRLGPGAAEGSLAPGARLAVERRHADDRGQSRLPGHGRRALRRLQRHDRREALGVADRHRRRRGAGRPTWSTASSTCRSPSAGAACYGVSAARAPTADGPGTVYTFAARRQGADAGVRRSTSMDALVCRA